MFSEEIKEKQIEETKQLRRIYPELTCIDDHDLYYYWLRLYVDSNSNETYTLVGLALNREPLFDFIRDSVQSFKDSITAHKLIIEASENISEDNARLSKRVIEDVKCFLDHNHGEIKRFKLILDNHVRNNKCVDLKVKHETYARTT